MIVSPGISGRLRVRRGSHAASTPSEVIAMMRGSGAVLVMTAAALIGTPAAVRSTGSTVIVGGVSP